MGEIGDRLRTARESLGLSVKDVCEKTRISSQVIEAMENDDFSCFAGPVYARAFLRDYALALGIDEGPLLILLEKEDAVNIPKKIPVYDPSRPKKFANFAWLMTTLASALVAIGVLLVTRQDVGNIAVNQGTAAGVYKSTEPEYVPETEEVDRRFPSFPAGSGGRMAEGYASVTLRAQKDCWVRVSSQGGVLLEETLKPGTVRQFRSSEPIKLRVGDAGALYVRINYGPEVRMGRSGQVLDRIVKPESL